MFALAAIVFLSQLTLAHADEFKIPLSARSRIEPLLEWFGPIPGTRIDGREILTVDALGTRVTLPEGDASESNSAIGFKLLAPVAGNFEWELDLECLELQQPKSGWGQGLSMRVQFNDAARTTLVFGWCSRPDQPPMALVAKESRNHRNDIYEWLPIDFKKGTMVIIREDGNANLNFVDNGMASNMTKVDVPKTDIISFDVYVSRLEKDNTKSSFLLKETRLKAETHPALNSASPQRSWWSLVYLIEITALLSVALLWWRTR